MVLYSRSPKVGKKRGLNLRRASGIPALMARNPFSSFWGLTINTPNPLKASKTDVRAWEGRGFKV